jgi:hypothetical protein
MEYPSVRFYIFIIFLLMTGMVAQAQQYKLQPMPAKAERIYAQTMANARPDIKNLILNMGEAWKGKKPDPKAIAKQAHHNFGKMGKNDIDELVMMVLIQSSKDEENDLQGVMNQMQQITRQKAALRNKKYKADDSIIITKSVIKEINEHKSSENISDLSTQDQLEIQMVMDRRSQAYEMISNMMKNMSDTNDAIIGNIKN